jgi:anthranilate phosphoribosyltransferase
MGVFHPDLVGIQVRVLQRLGAEHACGRHGRDGMDEISLGAATLVGELRDGAGARIRDPPGGLRPADVGSRALKVARRPRSPRRCWPACWPTNRARRATSSSSTPALRLYAANVVGTVVEGIERARAALESLGAAAAQARRSSSPRRSAPAGA